MLVRNTAVEQKTIAIVKADGSKDTITLMPRGGNAVNLPKGASIDPDKIPEYISFLRTHPALELPKKVAPVASTPKQPVVEEAAEVAEPFILPADDAGE